MKLLKPITWALDRLYEFRINRMFMLPKEARAYRHRVDAELGVKRDAFRESVLSLLHVKHERSHKVVTIHLEVPVAVFFTQAGERAAQADIALHLAKHLEEFLKRYKQREIQRRKEMECQKD